MINPRYSHLTDDPILLNENVPNNGESKNGLYKAHTGLKVVNRDNTPSRPDSRILAEYRDTNSRILLALSDL